MYPMQIRPIQQADNAATAKMIREVLLEQKAPKTGTAYADPWLEQLYEFYEKPESEYFLLVDKGNVLGGAGIAPLDDDETTCELQKMYFQPEVRGRGLGEKMIAKCLDFARENGFRQCYIETLPWMKAAQKLYQRNGFQRIDHRMGNTGHYSCTVFLLKQL